jgi:hypothetical protein
VDIQTNKFARDIEVQNLTPVVADNEKAVLMLRAA